MTEGEGDTVGEKGNLGADDPLLTLDSIPLDAIKGSPETVNAWMDTYLKYREVKELRKANEVAADAAESAAQTAEAASKAAESAAALADTTAGALGDAERDGGPSGTDRPAV
jgi:hypothetical protein